MYLLTQFVLLFVGLIHGGYLSQSQEITMFIPKALPPSEKRIEFSRRTRLYKLDQPLLRLSKAGDFITRRDLVRGGVQIFGGPGSGKTSSSWKLWKRVALLDGHGMLELTCKENAVKHALEMAELCGRSKDVIHVKIGTHVFRFIQDAIKHHGSGKGVVEQIIERLDEAAHIANRKHSGAPSDEFWVNSKKQLMRDGTFVDMLANDGELSLLRLLDYIQTLPTNPGSLESPEHHSILKALTIAEKKCPENRRGELGLAKSFFTKEIINVGDRCRSSIQITASVALNPLLRYPLVDLFDGDGIEIDPEECIRENKIVILDVPSKVYGETVSKIAGCIFKLAFQQAVHRRWSKHTGDPDELAPFGIFADESHYFISESDLKFVDTCRETRGYIFYATQNLPGYEHELGATPQAKKIVETLLANLGIIIGHQNPDNGKDGTNQWLCERIGKEWAWVRSLSPVHNQDHENVGEFGRQDEFQHGFNQQQIYQFYPDIFLSLQCGTNASNPPNEVEAVVFNNGKVMKHNGKRALVCAFSQFNFSKPVRTYKTESRPTARNWRGYVDFREMLRAVFLAKDQDYGCDTFYRWANFWTDGTFMRSAAGGEQWR
jgi:hypothetical protein